VLERESGDDAEPEHRDRAAWLTVLRAHEETRYLVLEMGARHIGDIRYLAGLVSLAVGLVTNVGTAHVGEFGSRDAIARAKGELVEALPAASDGGLAVLSADDETVAAMAARTTARVLLYGRARHVDVRAVDVELDRGRARFRLSAAGVSAPVELRFLGEHQMFNALGAAAVAYGLGMAVPDIAAALSAAARWHRAAWRSPSGRTASRPSTTRSTPTPTPSAPRWRPWLRWRPGAGRSRSSGRWPSSANSPGGGRSRPGGLPPNSALASWWPSGAVTPRRPPGRRGRGGQLRAVVPDADAAVPVLEELLRPGDIVLAKASHAMHLEELAVTLATAGGPAA